MTRKTGMFILLGLAGTWVLGCAPASQMVKSEMPLATPTPTVAVTTETTPTATATATETLVPAPALPAQ